MDRFVSLGKNVRKCGQHHSKHKCDILEEYSMGTTALGLAELSSMLSLG